MPYDGANPEFQDLYHFPAEPGDTGWYSNNPKFRPVSWVIHMLVVNVSKNGNLLLNVVQRPDGSLDPEVEQMLEQLAAWNAVHGEAIFGSRPWTVYGESAVKVKGGAFNEDFNYNSKEIRFTTKGPTLYAIALGWPEDGRLLIRSLAKPQGANINNVQAVGILGFQGKPEWRQNAEGLLVTLPKHQISEFTVAVKITGTELTRVPFEVTATPVLPDARGRLTLSPEDAELEGGIRTENRGGKENLGFWDNGNDSALWTVRFPAPGGFRVSTACAAQNDGAEFVVEVGDQQLTGRAGKTGGWDDFVAVDLGRIEIKTAGATKVKVRPKDAAKWRAVNMRAIEFKPE